MGQACHIDVRFFRPPADMEGCFTTFYRVELEVPNDGIVEDYLQPEWANLRFFSSRPPVTEISGDRVLRDARLSATGPSSLPARFELGTNRMWGIGFFPLGWARFIGVDAAQYANRAIDGETSPVFSKFGVLCDTLFSGPADDDAEFAQLVNFFRKIDMPVKDEPRIRAVHKAIVDTNMSKVGELADRAGLSTRSLERLCRRHFGFPPKLLLRRQRFMRSLAAFMLHEGSSWSTVIDHHYHDQAQFVREFQAFMLMKPSEYAVLDHAVLRAFMAERKRIWGSAAQTLDKP